MIECLFANLECRDVLSEEEKAILRAICCRASTIGSGSDIVSQGARPGVSTLIIDGFAARYKLLEDGRRQITALQIAGDFVDLHAFLLKTMDHGILALSACSIVVVDHADLRKVTETEPHLTRMLWLDTLKDAAIHREWIVAMGRRSSKAQLAHLVCELFMRLSVVGRVVGDSFQFPVSQTVLADVLGMSVVHLNKTLQSLRGDGVLTWANHQIEILDWAALRHIAEFDPTYLNLQREPR
ncbi:Crp/Fnr family transcriptional regulator [Ensifer soli]|uniref:Crp/Fnr family transcriptional regulator n=1 Tax=Ciceribacter sp. sgz301302 TaxID=3342379 RepID=UPI0035B6F6BE